MKDLIIKVLLGVLVFIFGIVAMLYCFSLLGIFFVIIDYSDNGSLSWYSYIILIVDAIAILGYFYNIGNEIGR